MFLARACFAAAGAAQGWQLTAANRVAPIADVPVHGGALSLTVPAQSITLLVVPPDTAPASPPRRAALNVVRVLNPSVAA